MGPAQGETPETPNAAHIGLAEAEAAAALTLRALDGAALYERPCRGLTPSRPQEAPWSATRLEVQVQLKHVADSDFFTS